MTMRELHIGQILRVLRNSVLYYMQKSVTGAVCTQVLDPSSTRIKASYDCASFSSRKLKLRRENHIRRVPHTCKQRSNGYQLTPPLI